MKQNLLIGLFLILTSAGIISCGSGTTSGGGTTTLTSIAVTSASPSVFVDGTLQFTATGTYSDSTTGDITSSVTWSSSSTTVATISSTGLATGVATGTSTITATKDGISGTTSLTTTQAPAGKIAFVSSRDDSIDEIYVMDTDGGNQVRVTSHSGSSWTEMDLDPVWSPDASQIVFTSWRDGLNELFIVNPDGTGEARLTSMSTPTDWNDEPAWSPDGSKIAFTSYRTGGTQIYTMNADGSSQTRITSAVEPYIGGGLTFYYANWSPDGTEITGETHWSAPSEGDAGGIYTFTSGGLNSGAQLTHNADDHNATWSPDSSQIAFYRLNSSANPTGADIYVATPGNETKLAEGINPIWSPDSTKIAFLREDNGFKLFVMNVDGTGEVNLMTGFDNLGVAWTPSWSTDGSQLVFSDGSEIYIINSDGTGLVKVTTGAEATGPMWSPQ